MLNLPDTGHSWTENWLFKLANDNATFLYLALSDVTYSSNFYEGAILNKPSIRESIDLSNSTAKTGNISIQIADYNYNGSPISEELFGGSNHYMNQTVTVHSKINAETPIQIGTFRLTDISTDGDKISLSLASHRPWDFISVPKLWTSFIIIVPQISFHLGKNSISRLDILPARLFICFRERDPRSCSEILMSSFPFFISELDEECGRYFIRVLIRFSSDTGLVRNSLHPAFKAFSSAPIIIPADKPIMGI